MGEISMIAPLFVIAAADGAVQGLLGAGTASDPVRLYPFGTAPQGVAKPYAVYQTIRGSPENILSGRPDTDSFVLQVDVYGITTASVRAVTTALNNALETESWITRWGNESFDPVTKHFRFDFDVAFITPR
jgi:hypothetical protein